VRDLDPKTQFSTLCGYVTEDDITVRAIIFRPAGSGTGWSLEVRDDQETSTMWSETFPTEQDALKAFYEALQKDGIRSFLT
jgi:hypothetical protein